MSETAVARPAGQPAPPAPGLSVRLRDGIRWIRQPLPFALDHVNCWLLGTGRDSVLIDTGISSDRSRGWWQAVFNAMPDLAEQGGHTATALPGRLLVTHFHPDHAGLAGWFHAAGVPLLGNAVEISMLERVWQADSADYGERCAAWYAANGLPPDAVERVRIIGNGYQRIVAEPPASSVWRTLTEGDQVESGGFSFRVLLGRGHAPAMLMLYAEREGLLIAADQVLPQISPNVSVTLLGEDNNPLASFLDSLERLRELPADTLVLPSHGEPFTGLHARLDTLAAHHDERLAAVKQAVAEPVSAAELFPLLFRRELDDQQLFFALGECLAHLHWLQQAGEVTSSIDADDVRRWSVSG